MTLSERIVTLDPVVEEGANLVKKVDEALVRLEKNKDFQLLIDTYTINYALDKVSLFATSNTQLDRKILLELMVSIANFKEFLGLIRVLAERVRDDEKVRAEEAEEESNNDYDVEVEQDGY